MLGSPPHGTVRGVAGTIADGEGAHFVIGVAMRDLEQFQKDCRTPEHVPTWGARHPARPIPQLRILDVDGRSDCGKATATR